MKLEQLVYVSRTARPARSVMDVSDILEESIRHNPANNITGALAFTPTHFVQLLEGSPSSIDVLLLRLIVDTRHSDLVIIDRIAVAARSFGSWSMVSPVFTATATTQLESLLTASDASLEDFRALMLEMVALQDAALTSRTEVES